MMKSERRRHLLRLAGMTAAMFAFGFALVPLYRVACQLTGVNLQANEMRVKTAAAAPAVDQSRWITVQFTTTVNGGLDWKFHPETPRVRLHPGEYATVSFYAENPADDALVAQAVPSITPLDAAKHLHKTECFCFTQQTFLPHEGRHMPVRFTVDTDLPENVDTVTLSYTFFDVSQLTQAHNHQAHNHQAHNHQD